MARGQQGCISDNVRQQFTSKERDVETGLDYFLKRYYANVQGRFTSPDVLFADQSETDPQSWNLYTYVGNNPVNTTDPFGLWKKVDCDNGGDCWEAEEGDTWADLAMDAGFSGFPAETGAFLQNYFQNVPIEAGVTTVDVSLFMAWKQSLSFQESARIRLSVPVEVDFGAGGGLRQVGKAAAKSGLVQRFVRWLGFGKKAAPVRRSVKEISDELGYFPSNAVKQALKGQIPREAVPAAERDLASKFYERVANEVVSGPKEAEARALNLARAKFLKEGGSPPIDIHPFEP